MLLICPKCHKSIRVPEAIEDEATDDDQMARRSTRRDRDDDDREDRADRRVTSRPRATAPEVRSKSRRNDNFDDDGDDRDNSRRTPKKSGVGSPVILIAGGIIVLMAVCAVTAVAVILWSAKAPAGPQTMVFTGMLFPTPPRQRQPDSIDADEHFAKQKEKEKEEEKELEKQREAEERAIAEAPRPPRSLDWASLNIAGIDTGDLAARPAANFEALRYMPGQADSIMGVDTGTLGSKLLFSWLMEQITTLGDICPTDQLQRETGFGLKDIDHIVVAGQFDFGHENWLANKPFAVNVAAYAIKTKTPFNRDTIVQVARAGPAKQAFGKEYYPIPGARNGKQVNLYFPTDSIVVVSTLPDDQLGGMLKLGGETPAIQPDAMAAIRALGWAHAWCVSPPAPILNQMPLGAALPASVKPVVDAVSRSKSVGLAFRFHGTELQLSLALVQSNEAEAKKVSSSLSEFWNSKGKQAVTDAANKQAPGLQNAIIELVGGLKWEPHDQSVLASAPVHFKAVDEMLKAAK
jgi:hypothetical protein